MKPPASGKAIRKLAAIGAFASIVSSGCARLVTVNREEAASRNDLDWRLQTSPKQPGEPAITVVPIGPGVPWRNEPEIRAALRSKPAPGTARPPDRSSWAWSLTLGLSAGFVVAAAITAATGSDPRPLQRYYRETYVDPR